MPRPLLEYLGTLVLRVLAVTENMLPRSWRSRCWAWLGCYRQTLKVHNGHHLPVRPFTVRALAACGDTQQAEQIARSLREKGARRATAVAVAAFHPRLACQLLEGTSPTPLHAAVLSAIGQRSAATSVFHALPARLAPQPDIALLRANCGLVDPLAALNTCWHSAGLATISGPHSPQSPFNLHTGVSLPLIEGPLVSIIIPAHNTESLVEAAVGSLLEQTWRNVEILAVDDASTDGTLQKLERLAAKDSRVKIISHSRNLGPYAARMTALAQAQGELVTCHDSDDWAHPQRIEKQAAPLVRHARVMATVSDWVRMADDGTFYVRKSWPLIHHNPASVMFRREPVLDRMGGFDLVRAGADSEFYERLKVVFGAGAVRRTKGILAVGSHRVGSLMNDPKIGVTNHVLSPSRLAYWEAWRHWHVESLRAGKRPFMPATGARPFPAPAEILAR